MTHNSCACRKDVVCHNCPPPPKPHKLSTGYLNHHISAKMRLAQLLKVKGTFQPGNHHTPNLPGTKRQVVQKKNAHLTWRCHGDTELWGF